MREILKYQTDITEFCLTKLEVSSCRENITKYLNFWNVDQEKERGQK